MTSNDLQDLQARYDAWCTASRQSYAWTVVAAVIGVAGQVLAFVWHPGLVSFAMEMTALTIVICLFVRAQLLRRRYRRWPMT